MNSKRLLKKAASPQESFKENLPCYIMIAPFILLFILFLIIPIAASVVLSLFDFDMVSAPRFIGFSNYFRMFFDDEVFVTIVKNTLVLALITGPVGFALSFVLAWFLNEFKPFMRTLLSFMFYIKEHPCIPLSKIEQDCMLEYHSFLWKKVKMKDNDAEAV